MCAQHVSADIYFCVLHAVQPTYITPHCKHTSSIGKHHYVIILGLLRDVGTHMGSIGKQVIMSSLPDWHWRRAQLVSRSHYYAIMLGDVGTHMGSIGKQVITSSLPDWHWHQAQLVSRSHYYVIMLGDVGTHMGLIGKQNLLQLHHYMCYVIRKFSPAASLRTHPHTLPAHAPRPLARSV